MLTIYCSQIYCTLYRSLYRSTLHVSSTSNICERLFSNAKLIMSHLRSHMDPDSLAMLLFLKANKRFWVDKSVIDDIITSEGNDDEEEL